MKRLYEYVLIIVDKEDENAKGCDYRSWSCRFPLWIYIGTFGITDEIVLVDVDKDKAYAQALDIADSVSFCERETVVRSGDYKDCEDAAIVVIAIGEARKRGRQDLIC